LRTDRGIDAATGKALAFKAAIDWALDVDLAQITGDDRIVLTTRGRLLSNDVFARLV